MQRHLPSRLTRLKYRPFPRSQLCGLAGQQYYALRRTRRGVASSDFSPGFPLDFPDQGYTVSYGRCGRPTE